ncbi:protein CROWDED NUCLEI 1 [Benincasa hispida]|uniref:protein CROWDED NUCLEI 1 n=1 Tax=Benincasa hispida TaxID=102211 RepID=UPI001900FB1C|nr:protein CROWDED NUCLEI 1 [Benincasa hispida]
MFTPQKVWSGWPLTPKTGTQKTGAGSASNPNSVTPNLSRRGDGIKGKTVAFGETATPLSGTLVENGGEMFVGSAEAAALDQEGLAEKISRLENELFEYQYNMGLLLIEKKDWTLKYEELKQALADAKDTLKREQMAHMIAISDAEKQEENLKKALGVEKECVLDLEKALHEMRAENAEIKFTGDSKLAEANALVASIEEKSLEVEAKLRAADAKLAEVSRKNSEVERKLQDLEAREGALRRDRLSFNAEREAHEATMSKQRDELREWERKLQDAEERLAKGQTILNQREERANENDRMVKQKEKDLEELQKKIDSANLALKRKEEDISSRLANIALKEQESDSLKVSLEIKEKELLVLEEKLSARERVEIQKLLDEHNAILDAKKVEFELEIDQKRKSLDEELKNKVSEVEKKEAEIKHMEEKVGKREQALEKRTEKFKEKEADYDTKFKALKQREKSMKSEEKNLEAEKKLLLADKEDLISLKAEVEKIRAENEAQLLKLHEERESLKVSETERSDFLRLQSELKQEIEKYRQQKELLLKEAEDLKQQKETFEREWEELDEKRVQVEKEQKNLLLQKEEFEKRIFSEEERLKNERTETEAYIHREQDNLKLAQESFAASMEHEKSAVAEKAQSERSKMMHDFELQKRELESAMQIRVEEMEREFREKEKSFKEEKERELENIKFLRDVARREMDELKLERLKTEKEKQEAEANKEHLERQRIEIRKDIEELFELSNKLKDQRERLVAERDRFISYVDKHMTCKNCGEIASEFVLSDLQSLDGIENAYVLGLPDRYMEIQGLQVSPGGNLGISDVRNGEQTPGIAGQKSPISAGTISWLRKCTSKIFRFSPGKKIASPAFEKQDDEAPAPASDEHDDLAEPSKRMSAGEDEAELSLAIASDSLDDKRIQSDVSGREVEPSQNFSTDNLSNINSKAPEIAVDSRPSDAREKQRKPRPKRGQPKINRTRSVKAVVEDAKAIIGELQETQQVDYPNGNAAEDSSQLNNESRDESSLAGKGRQRNLRKRTRANSSQIMGENDNDDSEVRSGSVVEGQPRKRRQRAVPAAVPEKRYNLRRTKVVGASKDPSNVSKENEEDAPVNRTEEDAHYSRVRPTPSMGVASDNAGSTHLVRCGTVGDNQDDGIAGTSKISIDMVSLSEEVNGSPENASKYGGRSEYRSESCEEVENEDEDDDEESEHPGEVSIGKKLWTFFTT